jgi:hypothetical protein
VYFYYDFKWHHVNYVHKNVFICSYEDIDPVPEPQGSSSSDEFISEPHFPIRKRSKHRGKGRGWVEVEAPYPSCSSTPLGLIVHEGFGDPDTRNILPEFAPH